MLMEQQVPADGVTGAAGSNQRMRRCRDAESAAAAMGPGLQS